MTLRDDATRCDDRGADDTTRCDDGKADDRGADDTTRCDDTFGDDGKADDRGADDASRCGLMDVICDVASDGRAFVDKASVYLNKRSACI